jgi:hypothetical protein
VPQKEQVGQGHRLRLWTAYENPLPGVLKNQHVAQASDDFILQQDGAPPNFHLEVRRHLNTTLPQRWIGRTSNEDSALIPWPPGSPDLTPCDFFLWGYVKDKVYVPTLPVYQSFDRELWLQLIPSMLICCNVCGKR